MRISVFCCAATLLFATAAQAQTVVWLGVDYSLAKMSGKLDFRETDKIFPGYLQTWNDLVLKEQLKKLEKKLQSPVEIDLDAVTASNDKATDKQVVNSIPGATQLDDDAIAKKVKSYKVGIKDGVGLVFIVERLEKAREHGCVFITFFDLATREVKAAERVCGKARGFGFRNYWFGPIKEAIDQIDKI